MSAVSVFGILTGALAVINLAYHFVARKALQVLDEIEADLKVVQGWLMAVTGGVAVFSGATAQPVPALKQTGSRTMTAGEWRAKATRNGHVDTEPPGPSVMGQLVERIRNSLSVMLSLLGIMGIVATPLFLAALYMNSMIIADRLWTIFQTTPDSIFVFEVFGGAREVTYYDMIGFLVSLLQASSATIFLIVAQQRYDSISAHNDPVNIWLHRISAWALVVLVTFEVIVNVWGGVLVGEALTAGAIALVLALGGALSVAVLGAVSLHFCVLPLLRLIVCAALYLPAAALRWLSGRRSEEPRVLAQSAGSATMFGRWLMIAGDYTIEVTGPSRWRVLTLRGWDALDRVLFHPLCVVDRVVSTIWAPIGGTLAGWWRRRDARGELRRAHAQEKRAVGGSEPPQEGGRQYGAVLDTSAREEGGEDD